MKILLVQPNNRTLRGIVAPPLGIMSIAAVLQREGFEVKIFDQNIDKNYVSFLKMYSPDVVGIGSMTGPMLINALQLVNITKSILGDSVKIVWGGIHGSSLPEQVMKEKNVDFVVIGEGEHIFLELVKHLKNNMPSSELKNIKGIAYRKEKEIRVNEHAELIQDLDKLPWPAWNLVKPRKYLRYETALVTSRGCPGGCRFCYNRIFNKRYWRSMSSHNVIDYINYLDSLYPIKRVKFYDDNAAVNKKRFLEIISNIKKSPLYCEIRPDYINEEFASSIKRYSSDPYIFIGVESGSQKMLDYLNKGTNIQQITNCFKILNKHRIDTTASFMIGLPEETKEDVDKTVRFVSKLNPTRYTCCLYVPFPGSPLYEEIVQKGLFKPPTTMVGWANVASAENANINVSNVSSEYLNKIYNNMFLKSILMFLKRGRIKPLAIGAQNMWEYYKDKLATVY